MCSQSFNDDNIDISDVIVIGGISNCDYDDLDDDVDF